MRAGWLALASVIGLLACHSQRPIPADSATNVAKRSVFTDSALHAELCEPVHSGEDWRKVCTPKDQSVRLPQPKSPDARRPQR
jgi:hypothetical protein